MHRLNKCIGSLSKINERHNAIVKVVRDGIMEKFGNSAPPIIENSQVFIDGLPDLSEKVKNLKPDIWYASPEKDKLRVDIVEITCPYGMISELGNARTSTLEHARAKKIEKYSELVEEIRSKWKAKVTLFTIVVSSLGAVPKETLKDLISLTGDKKKATLIAKKCCLEALRHSWSIFTGRGLQYAEQSAPITLENRED